MARDTIHFFFFKFRPPQCQYIQKISNYTIRLYNSELQLQFQTYKLLNKGSDLNYTGSLFLTCCNNCWVHVQLTAPMLSNEGMRPPSCGNTKNEIR